MKNRTTKLIDIMPADFKAALIKTEANRFYFTGLNTGDAGVLLILKNKSYFVIDSRYIETALKTVTTADVVLEKIALTQISEILKENNINSLYLEDGITLEYFAKLKNEITGIDFVCDETLSSAVSSIREIKDDTEIEKIKKAQKITDDCFTYICGEINEGMREIDIALMMESFIRQNGGDGLAFDTILVSGENTSLPHGEPGTRRIQNGDFITMDFGAKVGGYCTDMTRTVAFGSVTEQMEKVYNIVLQAQLAGCAAVKAGVSCFDVDKAARDIISKTGYGDNFGHGLGHSLGIEIHENPRFSPSCTAITKVGHVMTVEPGIYLSGNFGIRIEDTVYVTENGCENFAKSTKNLIVLQ